MVAGERDVMLLLLNNIPAIKNVSLLFVTSAALNLKLPLRELIWFEPKFKEKLDLAANSVKALPSTDLFNKLLEKSTLAKVGDDTEKVAGEMDTSMLLAIGNWPLAKYCLTV